MITFEGFSMMILNFLRIPPGSSLRKNHGKSNTDSKTTSLQNSDLINSMVEITAEDVCIGNSPFYYDCDPTTPKELMTKLECIRTELNGIAQWAAKDLLKLGYSAYEVEVKDDKLFLFPLIEELEFYYTSTKEVLAYTRDGDTYKSKNDLLLFINFEKEDLQEVEDLDKIGNKKVRFKINPSPIQLRNVSETAPEIALTERAMLRYRKQLSRIVRFGNVDIGVSSGDKQQDIIDTISSAINADSLSLTPTSDISDFDDTIPILPNRKGVGKLEIEERVPDFDISKLADMDYYMSKLHLAMRFPKTYSDFSQSLDQTAVSMIRGDERYSRMINRARSLMEDTVNLFIATSKALTEHNVKFNLTKLPTPEDEDVVASLENFTDFSSRVYKFIITESENKKEALLKLSLLQDLFGSSSKFPTLQNWFDRFEKHIVKSFVGDSEDGEGGFSESDLDMDDFGDSEDIDITEEIGEDETPPEEPESE